MSLLDNVETGGPPALYERYILALAWQPVVAADACPQGSAPNPALVRAMDDFATIVNTPAGGVNGPDVFTSLSAFGLWPLYVGLPEHQHAMPTYCNRTSPPGCADASEADPRCALEAPAVAAFNTSAGWQRYALSYAWSSAFTVHAWRRHGSCTPWTQQGYFEALEDAVDDFDLGDGRRAIFDNAGGNVSASYLRAAFQADTGAPPALRCAPRSCLLSQVWLGLRAKAGSLRPLTARGHGVPLSSADEGCVSCAEVTLALWRASGAGGAAARARQRVLRMPGRMLKGGDEHGSAPGGSSSLASSHAAYVGCAPPPSPPSSSSHQAKDEEGAIAASSVALILLFAVAAAAAARWYRRGYAKLWGDMSSTSDTTPPPSPHQRSNGGDGGVVPALAYAPAAAMAEGARRLARKLSAGGAREVETAAPMEPSAKDAVELAAAREAKTPTEIGALGHLVVDDSEIVD